MRERWAPQTSAGGGGDTAATRQIPKNVTDTRNDLRLLAHQNQAGDNEGTRHEARTDGGGGCGGQTKALGRTRRWRGAGRRTRRAVPRRTVAAVYRNEVANAYATVGGGYAPRRAVRNATVSGRRPGQTNSGQSAAGTWRRARARRSRAAWANTASGSNRRSAAGLHGNAARGNRRRSSRAATTTKAGGTSPRSSPHERFGRKGNEGR